MRVDQPKPPRPVGVFRRVEETCWHIGGYGSAKYYKDGRKMRFSYWDTYDLDKSMSNSIWVAEYKFLPEAEAEELCRQHP